MTLKKFEFSIGGYGGSSYSLEFKNGLFSYRCTNDEYRLIELINPVIPEGDNPDWDDIITKKDSFDADLNIADKKNRTTSQLHFPLLQNLAKGIQQSRHL